MAMKKKELMAGAPAPDINLPTDGAEPFSLSALRGKTVVLYFYPKDDTAGCTTEAIDFSAAGKAFARAGAVVVGVSKDGVEKHARFRKKHGLSVILASDEDGKALAKYGVWVKKTLYGRTYMGIERSTFLIDGKGIIREAWRKVRVAGHVEAVLEATKGLK